ncbi:MAG: HupE/UreJ family protein [Candidatus Binatia bacterium]
MNLAGGSSLGTSFASVVALGVEHILTGYDHLVFLLGLLLLGGRLGDVVRIVTGFTVAHSLTLALAVFGVARPPSGAIEALIGLSIALVATENLWLSAGRRPAVRWAVVLGLAGLAVLAATGRGAVPA